MINDTRPDPDIILENLKKRQKKHRGGRLYLFLGMAPGVGKTYAMILAGHEAKKSGIDVVVGVAETHGRAETQKLLEGLEILPKVDLEYRGIIMPEMDLDGILLRKPKVVLVDELAHTNVPGSRHAKRWQDVYEILDAGIDVFSTLNVQHLESRKELVEQIAGISIRETVPDSVIDRAYQIRLIDLSPQDLIKRLKEGKVYLGEKANLAADNFFKEDRLTALREISLRLMAEKVDYDLQSYAAERSIEDTWIASERLMVLVGHTSASQALIRATRKLAFNLEVPWFAVYIDTGLVLSDEQEASLSKNLNLARSLGAEVITLTDTNISSALARLALQKSITQLVIGRNSKSLIDQLLKKSSIDIHVVAAPSSEHPARRSLRDYLRPRAGLSSYVKTSAFIAALFLFNWLLEPIIGYRAVGFVFLLGTLLAGLVISLGPLLLLALSTALIWDAFFIPRIGSLKTQATEDFFMVTTYFVAAMATGILSWRSQKHQNILANKEERSQILYEISKEIATNVTKESMINTVNDKLGKFLNAKCAVLLTRRDGSLKSIDTEKLKVASPDKEQAVAQWVLDNLKPAGWSTDTLAGAEALYVPLKGSLEKIGVLAFVPHEYAPMPIADQNLLFSVARLLAISLEKELFRERSLETERLLEMDRMHRILLNLVSDEIRRPLTQVASGIRLLGEENSSLLFDRGQQLSKRLLEILARIQFTTDNLLTMSRLNVGIFPLQKETISCRELIISSQELIALALENHILELTDQAIGLEISVDVLLFQRALANIFLNAATFSPENSVIKTCITQSTKSALITISDEGPGVPEEELGRIFEKFYQIAGTEQGIGIGLAIAKGIVKAHGAKISASSRPGQGLTFTISVPKAKTAL